MNWPWIHLTCPHKAWRMNPLDFLPSVCHWTLDERPLLLWQRRTLPHTAHKSKKCDSSNPTADTITNFKRITHKKQIIALCLPNKCKYWFSIMGCDETLPRQKLFQTYRMWQWRWGGKEKVRRDSFPVNPVTGLYPRVSVGSPPSRTFLARLYLQSRV